MKKLSSLQEWVISVAFAGVITAAFLFATQNYDLSKTYQNPSEGTQRVINNNAVQGQSLESLALPQRLIIPSIGVDSSVEHVGLDEKKRMDVPKLNENVAWYELGPIPGQTGQAVLSGHLDSKEGPAVFYRLGELEMGDEILLYDEDGGLLTYEVFEKAVYKNEGFPILDVFGPSEETRLNLITCAGEFDSLAEDYSDRIVIYSRLVN
jgi:LPXTG-site transpeptidase (sortase) family protein